MKGKHFLGIFHYCVYAPQQYSDGGFLYFQTQLPVGSNRRKGVAFQRNCIHFIHAGSSKEHGRGLR